MFLTKDLGFCLFSPCIRGKALCLDWRSSGSGELDSRRLGRDLLATLVDLLMGEAMMTGLYGCGYQFGSVEAFHLDKTEDQPSAYLKSWPKL